MTANTTAPAFPELAAAEAAYNEALEKLEALNHRHSEAQLTLVESRDSLAAFDKERKQLLKRQALGGSTPETAAALAKINADHAAAVAALQAAENFLAIFQEVELEGLNILGSACGQLAAAARKVAFMELEKARKRLYEAISGPLAEVLGWQDLLMSPSPDPVHTVSRLPGLISLKATPPPFTIPALSLNHIDKLRRAGYY